MRLRFAFQTLGAANPITGKMLTLRTIEIPFNKNADDLITNLQWQTGKSKMFLGNPLFRIDNEFPKKWIGKIFRDQMNFSLVRPVIPITYLVRGSKIVINGAILENQNERFIRAKFQLNGPTLFGSVIFLLIGSILFLLVDVETLLAFWWVPVIWLTLFTVNFMTILNDLNKTESYFMDFINQQESVITRT